MSTDHLDIESAEAALSELTEKQASKLATDLRDLAVHMSGRIQYTESRLATMAGLGGALIAFGTAILSLISVLGANVSRLFWLAVLIFAASSILSGLVVWFVYARQTNFPYAFKGFDGPRTWFYRDAIPTQGSFEIPVAAYFDPEGAKAAKASRIIRNEFVNQWGGFAEHVGSVLTDPQDHAIENLRQVYLLHYNEFYKNRFLSHLRSVLRKLIQWVLVPELVFLIFLAFAELAG